MINEHVFFTRVSYPAAYGLLLLDEPATNIKQPAQLSYSYVRSV